MLQWFFTDTARSSKLVFETSEVSAQSECGLGLGEEVAIPVADQAAAPIVRVKARLMDGGHRLQTLVEFYKGEIPMAVKGHEVCIGQLPQTDDQHFCSRKLQVMEFKNLLFKDEVDYCIKLNSALPLSWGK